VAAFISAVGEGGNCECGPDGQYEGDTQDRVAGESYDVCEHDRSPSTARLKYPVVSLGAGAWVKWHDRRKEEIVPGPTAVEVVLTDEERKELEALVRAGKTPQRIVFRARIILTLAEVGNVTDAAEYLGTRRETARIWREYWIERAGRPTLSRLADAERPGTPARITPEQWCKILALACEEPEKSGRPITHWTPRELAEEAIKREIVTTISPRHVGRFLGSGRVEAAQNEVLAQPRARRESR
jgi:putative transposase